MDLPKLALALSPHPDDLALGCGGTLMKISLSGGKVDAVYVTNGELGVPDGTVVTCAVAAAVAQQRSKEALEESRILEVRKVIFLNGNDGHLRQQLGLAKDILKILEENDYQAVFCPWREDIHPDHTATFDMLRQALQEFSRSIQVWLYEVWNPMRPNTAVVIDDTVAYKIQAIKAHASQLACKDYLAGFLGLARFRSLFCAAAQYAEAFYVCDAAELLKR